MPNDPESPFVTSGIRVGTPSITTRGFKEAESREVAALITALIDDMDSKQVISDIKSKVSDLCKLYPMYEY